MTSNPDPVTRLRDFFGHTATGLGGVALAWLLHREGRGRRPCRIPPGPHFPPKAKRVLHIFCPGGVSHVDTFDYKPDLIKLRRSGIDGQRNNRHLLRQTGSFAQESVRLQAAGRQRTLDQLRCFRTCPDVVDDLAFVHSMVAKSSRPRRAAFPMNSGFTMAGFPLPGLLAVLRSGLGRSGSARLRGAAGPGAACLPEERPTGPLASCPRRIRASPSERAAPP